MPNHSTIKSKQSLYGMGEGPRPRRRFTPAMREPWHLPDQKIELPSPSQLPQAPASINLLTTILLPVVMMGGMVLYSLFAPNVSLWAIVPMMLMSVGFPIVNVIGYFSSRKAHVKALAEREQAYRQKLQESRGQIQQVGQMQSRILQEAYPAASELLRITASRGALLWARRQSDEDFLSLRFGRTSGKPSFIVETPRYFDPNDILMPLASQLAGEFTRIDGVPALLEMSRIGSLALSGKVSSVVYGLARRLVLDLVVHHSPQNVQLAAIADTREALDRWEWLKWLPHADTLEGTARVRRLAFETERVTPLLEWLTQEFQARRGRTDNFNQGKPRLDQPAIVVLLDDSGAVRQNADVALLADLGWSVGIYVLFIGGRGWPRETRGRLEAVDDRRFQLVETWVREGLPVEGEFESASIEDCLRAARTLAGLEMGGAQSSTPLPASIRISEVVGSENLSLDAITLQWQRSIAPKEQLQFPIGVRARREGLDLAMLNLLPEKADGHDVGGYDAYHTILIGTTGSGKSEFMKSMVMGAAMRYPPNLLNFFFLDFKGGAAFSVFETLPHVSGIVTNLSPELVERGLDSIRNEIDRRQEEFAQARVRDIWAYNSPGQGRGMPHLILFLDEFARGLADFPRLRETLDTLVRLGRSLGMYLVLANQDANSEVDKLLNNVGWRIALKVAKPEEMSAMIGRGLSMATRAGQGYLKRGDEVIEFQAGYAGLPVRTTDAALSDEYSIFEVEPDGSYRKLYTHSSTDHSGESLSPLASLKEEELIVQLLREATETLSIKPAPKIYLDPLPEKLSLEQLLADSGLPPRFVENAWQNGDFATRLLSPMGLLDMPRECRQEQLLIDFEDQDGHLWIVGAPGSGKEAVLASLVLSLARSYSPDEVRFYMLELGGGDLRVFEGLPHTGAVIRPMSGEKERFERLLDYLEAEMDRRTAHSDDGEERSREPFLFLLINNFAELRANFSDEAERLARFVRDGKRARIHLIVTTNRGPELASNIRSNIARRLVLQLGTKDEHIELVGREFPMLQGKVPGRAYWFDGAIFECQIGLPEARPRELLQAMNNAWQGSRPLKIEILPRCLPYLEFSDLLVSQAQEPLAGVGQAYEDLALVASPLTQASQTWLVLGPKESGKSNFLASLAGAVRDTDPAGTWQVRLYSLRRSLLTGLEADLPQARILATPEAAAQDLNELIASIQAGSLDPQARTLLLVDDLGAAFQPNREGLANALNTLAGLLENVPGVMLVASSLLDELRMQLGTPLVKVLKQSRMGLVLSRDNSELDWLGAQITLSQRRMDMPPGRAFFINRGRAQLVQTPLWGECPKKK